MRKFKKLKKFKKRKINANKIYLLDWEKTKPYNGNKKYSEFYTQLANDILRILQNQQELLRTQELGIAECKQLAMILASYFEDYINEIGIWEYFIKKNEELYGWSVPFYMVDADREEDEIYVADIAFIIWYFISQINDVLMNPDLSALMEIAEDVFEIFEEKIDIAPTTNFYDQYFDISDDIPFFELKKRLNWFALGSYLLGFEFNMELADSIEELQETSPELFEHNSMYGKVIYSMQDDYNYKQRSSLSAISNLEWFSAVATCSDSMKADILQLHKRILGRFFYEGETETYYHFRNVHTNRVFEVHKDSFDLDKSIKEGDMAAFTIVKWKGDWWLSGMFVGMGKRSNSDIKDMKKDISSFPFYAYSDADQANTWDVINEGHEAFIEFFGNPIKIFKDKSEMQIEMNDFYVFQRKKTMEKQGKSLSKEDIKETKRSMANMLSSINRGVGRPVAAVSVDKVGMVFTEAIPELITHLQSDQLPPQVQRELFFDVFIDDLHPTTARDILATYPTQHLQMPFTFSTVDVLSHAEFFFRYYSPNEFGEQVPNMRVVPEGMDMETFRGGK